MAPEVQQRVHAGACGQEVALYPADKAARNVAAHWQHGAGTKRLEQALLQPQATQRVGR